MLRREAVAGQHLRYLIGSLDAQVLDQADSLGRCLTQLLVVGVEGTDSALGGHLFHGSDDLVRSVAGRGERGYAGDILRGNRGGNLVREQAHLRVSTGRRCCIPLSVGSHLSSGVYVDRVFGRGGDTVEQVALLGGHRSPLNAVR